MPDTPLVRRAAVWNPLYFVAAAALIGLITRPAAASFAAEPFSTRLLMCSGYFGAAMLLTFVPCLRRRSTNWQAVALDALIMLLAASITYSFIRQELVVVVYASLFCLPGAVFGALLAGVCAERLKARTATEPASPQAAAI